MSKQMTEGTCVGQMDKHQRGEAEEQPIFDSEWNWRRKAPSMTLSKSSAIAGSCDDPRGAHSTFGVCIDASFAAGVLAASVTVAACDAAVATATSLAALLSCTAGDGTEVATTGATGWLLRRCMDFVLRIDVSGSCSAGVPSAGPITGMVSP
jgi:hypothetical protein